ncbi:MAG: biotin synthase, partial [Eudoraea sp.]|nr:biotin synthase [Eudoraea sp.]
NQDMEMFRKLGLKPQGAFEKAPQPATIEEQDSKISAKGENPRWTRPGHKIDRNEKARARTKSSN